VTGGVSLMQSRLSAHGGSNGLDVLERHLASDASAPRLAREMVGQMALTPEIDERGRLLASEIVTNAVRHGGPGPILAQMARHANGLDVTVTDSGPGFEYTPAEASREPIGGLGLWLVDQMADSWSTGGPGDSSVHFRLDAPEMHRVGIAANAIVLSIGVTGYESTGAAGPEANWLAGEFELELRNGVAEEFKARMAVAWTTSDLLSFHRSLATLLDDSNGTAHLITADDQVELAITLEDGVGVISGRAAQTTFAGVPIGHRDLEPALDALDLIVHAYPRRLVKG
jgi:anti-sigma regulatory factor (Ser/Thr protein kinase)